MGQCCNRQKENAIALALKNKKKDQTEFVIPVVNTQNNSIERIQIGKQKTDGGIHTEREIMLSKKQFEDNKSLAEEKLLLNKNDKSEKNDNKEDSINKSNNDHKGKKFKIITDDNSYIKLTPNCI